MSDPWQECLDLCVEVTKQAGKMIREALQKDIAVMQKSSPVDLVTETDQRVEQLIISSIKEKYPAHRFIGEESVAAGAPSVLTDDPTWIIDPIDGTTNFVHRFPFVSVSIGFTVKKEIKFGVVYSCIEDKMYTARKGKGAFCNGDPIKVSGQEDISQSLVLTEMNFNKDPERFQAMLANVESILTIPVHGSALAARFFLWVGLLQEGGAGSPQQRPPRAPVMADPWQTAYDFAVQVARAAGAVIRKAGEEEIKIQTKSSAVDLVTKTDERVEKIIIGSLKEQFGDGTHCFIGEESVSKGEACILTDKPTWIIDPVDGTTNFVHGFPFVAVSIAFAVNKQLEFGVVYSCLEDKMYKARKGQGAFCDDEQIQVSDVNDIHKSIIISEHGTDRSIEKVTKIFSTMQKILRIPVHGLRGSGTAATNMCLVASGAVEAFFEIGIHCWDIAAGAVIVQEAGGLVLDVDGGPFDLMSRRMMSANNDVIARRIIKEIELFPVVRDDAPVQKK